MNLRRVLPLLAVTTLPFVGGLVAASCGGGASGECTGSSCQDAPAGISSPLPDGAQLGEDAGTTGDDDSGPLPGYEHFVDGWRLVPWAPGCGLYEPETDAGWAEIPPLTWVPCLSNRAGCQQLQVRTAYTGRAPISTLLSTAVINGHMVFALDRGYGPYYEELVLWDSTQGLVGAWRYDGPNVSAGCVSALGSLQGGVAALTVAKVSAPKSDTIVQWYEVAGSPSSLMARQVDDYTTDGNAIGAASGLIGVDYAPITTSAALMTYYWPAGNQLFARNRITPSSFERVSFPDGGVVRVDEPQWLVGDTVFFNAYTSPRTVGAWSPSTKYRTVVTPAAGAQSHSASTDGTWVVWEDSYDADKATNGGYTMATLYAAPFPAGTDALVPTSLGSVPCTSLFCDVTVSDGYVYAGDGKGNATVVRIADGARWGFAPMPNANTKDRFNGYGIVWNGELWISSELSGIERISVSALPQQ